jgi:small-conductance mechanosensitive channel
MNAAPKPIVVQPEAASAAGVALGELLMTVVVVAAALALTALLRRMGRARAFRRLHRALPAAQVLLWTLVLARGSMTFMARLEGGRLALAALFLAVVSLAALPLLRDVFCGLAFSLERRWAIGDDVRVGEVEGRITGLGVRSVRLRGRDGTERAVPYALAQRLPITRLALAALDAPCEFFVPVPEDMSPDQAMEIGRQAAALSPFASPRVRPEVFLELSLERRLSLRIRGFVFDRDQEERYRSDVNGRLFAAFPPRASAPAADGAPSAARALAVDEAATPVE